MGRLANMSSQGWAHIHNADKRQSKKIVCEKFSIINSFFSKINIQSRNVMKIFLFTGRKLIIKTDNLPRNPISVGEICSSSHSV